MHIRGALLAGLFSITSVNFRSECEKSGRF